MLHDVFASIWYENELEELAATEVVGLRAGPGHEDALPRERRRPHGLRGRQDHQGPAVRLARHVDVPHPTGRVHRHRALDRPVGTDAIDHTADNVQATVEFLGQDFNSVVVVLPTKEPRPSLGRGAHRNHR